MFIAKPADILRTARSGDKTNDGTALGLRIGRQANLEYLEDRDLVPSEEQYATAAALMSEITELTLSSEQTKAILSLYPHERIIVARRDGKDAEYLRAEDISFAAAHFFLNCSWPNYGDEVDMTAFVELLKSEAIRMGYLTTEPTKENENR